jgi:cobalamin biosynthesis Co2+ chelatase CbiK
MHGSEYDELTKAVNSFGEMFESVKVAEPLLGQVGADASEVNADKETVAKAITETAVSEAGFDSLEAAEQDKTAFVFMGHGTSHAAKVTYSQMQAQTEQLGYGNVFIGTVEGEPEETACEAVIEKVKAAGYTKIVLRPLMVVAGDHANNDMAGEDADSWLNMFKAAGFEKVDTQINGLGSIPAVQQIYVEHTGKVVNE